MNLRLDDHDGRAQFRGHLARLLGRRDHFAARRGHAEAAENLLRLDTREFSCVLPVSQRLRLLQC